MVDVEAGRGVRGDDLVQHLRDPGLGVVAEDQRHDRRVPVLGDGWLVGRVGVPDGLRPRRCPRSRTGRRRRTP